MTFVGDPLATPPAGPPSERGEPPPTTPGWPDRRGADLHIRPGVSVGGASWRVSGAMRWHRRTVAVAGVGPDIHINITLVKQSSKTTTNTTDPGTDSKKTLSGGSQGRSHDRSAFGIRGAGRQPSRRRRRPRRWCVLVPGSKAASGDRPLAGGSALQRKTKRVRATPAQARMKK